MNLFALRRPSRARELVKKMSQDGGQLEAMRKKVRDMHAIQEMQASSKGWKVIEQKLDEHMQPVWRNMADPSVSDEQVLKDRPALMAGSLLRAILRSVVAEGQVAERNLKLVERNESA